ncbi:MAG: hypothetical protein IH951_13735 [Bacteroidetes bacterium]|nr:hypothetical protein [Bacteroidota bacterium]
MHGVEEAFRYTGNPIDYGVIRTGLRADLLIVEENPLMNCKVLYGTRAMRLNDETGKPERVNR